METKTKVYIVYGGFIIFLLFIVMILTLVNVISWITFFIFFLIILILSALAFFIYSIFKGRKKEINEDDKIKLTEEECENISSLIIEDNYTDYIKEVTDKGTEHYGEENTPVFIFKCVGEWGTNNKKHYAVLINRINGSKRVINYDVKKLDSDDIDSLINKSAEKLSSKPRKDIRYKEIRDFGPVPGMERVIREPVTERKPIQEEKKEEGGLE